MVNATWHLRLEQSLIIRFVPIPPRVQPILGYAISPPLVARPLHHVTEITDYRHHSLCLVIARNRRKALIFLAEKLFEAMTSSFWVSTTTAALPQPLLTASANSSHRPLLM